MLDNLVGCVVGTTTNNPRLRAGFVLLDRDCVFTYVLEPHELDVAISLAVHTLCLILSDNDVAERRTRFQQEDCIGGA